MLDHLKIKEGAATRGGHRAEWGGFLPFLPSPRKHAGLENSTRESQKINYIRAGQIDAGWGCGLCEARRVVAKKMKRQKYLPRIPD